MKRMSVTLSALLVLLLITPSQIVAAAGGWISLFNGHDLSGWKAYGAERWVVEDGAILGESTAGKYGYLTTEKTYHDFVLRLRFKCETDGNSGVFTRSRTTGESPQTGPNIEGMQVEVDRTRHTGGLYESGGRGWVATPTPEGERAIKPHGWNDLEVTAQGGHVVTRLNGVQVVNFNDQTPRFTEGVIGLQLHTGGGVKVRFKDISIRDLSK